MKHLLYTEIKVSGPECMDGDIQGWYFGKVMISITSSFH